jgi:hypothetical protein
MAKSQPVTVDLLHPTAVGTFKNWGYISFFGCIAVLIPLMFFAINQAKHAYAQRQRTEVAAQPIGTVETKSYVYRNEKVGLTFDYRTFVIQQDKEQPFLIKEGSQGVTIERLPPACPTEFCESFSVAWSPSSATIDQLMQGEPTNPLTGQKPTLLRGGINGVPAVLVDQSNEFCGDNKVVFIHRGYRFDVDGPCSGWIEGSGFSGIGHSLHLF